MTERQRERAEEIYIEALDHTAEARESFARDACGDDPELLTEVLSLLDAARGAEEFLAALAGEVRVPYEAEPEDAEVGDVPLGGVEVGPYRLLRELGRGGSGSVYLAERADGEFEQRVAVKLLRRGLDTDDLLARFRAERQILASLAHPNIARLLDGGATAEGRPYLVMELVEGRPITEHCDGRRQTIAERLRIFVQVARAVEHAHRRLVVHRDIKPSNILVTADGTPKLLDFGIAKLLDDAADADWSPRTRTGVRLLTPEYASPEQLRGEPVTTASDAYQLGVLLYRLVCGRRPFRLKGLRPYEFERALRDEEIDPPSIAISRRSEIDREGLTADQLADLRRTDARRLRATLRGDLDTIVMRAVRSEPDRRYLTAGELADDVERYLVGRPVTARPDTWSYRTRKLIERRPAVAAAIVIGVMAVATYSVTVTRYAERLEAERDRAEAAATQAAAERDRAEFERTRAEGSLLFAEEQRSRAHSESERAEGAALRAQAAQRQAEEAQRAAEVDRDRAEIEAARAQSATEFLTSLFLTAKPGSEARGDTVSARTLLQRGAERVRTELSDQPAIAIDLMHTIAEVQGELGMGREAAALLEEVVQASRDFHGETHPEVATRLLRIGDTYRRDRYFVAAESSYLSAIAILRQQPTHHPLSMASALTRLASTHRENGNLVDAEIAIREALPIYRSRYSEDHPSVRSALHSHARVLRSLNRWEEAEALYRQLLAAEVAHPLELTVTPGGLMNDLAYLLRRQGRFAEAEPLYRDALSAVRSSRGPTDRAGQIVAGNLASVLELMGKLEEAETVLLDEVELHRAHFAADHWRYGHSLSTLAGFYSASGQHTKAETILREVIEIYSAGLGVEHLWTLEARARLADEWIQLGRTDAAEAKLLDVRESLLAIRLSTQRRELEKLVLDSLVNLYEAQRNSELAARYRSLLATLDQSD